MSTWTEYGFKIINLVFLELHGPINVVPAAFDKKKNMVILYKNGTLKHENNTNKGGVISFMGNNGEVAWFVKLKRRPTDIDCSLIDVNLDGFNDCLVVGDDDMLKAIHSISGNFFYCKIACEKYIIKHCFTE